MLLLIDNFDSFSYILADMIRQTGSSLRMVRNDVALAEIVTSQYQGIILSPGPGIPRDSGNLMQVLDYYHDKLPILGICLGHQAIGEYFGANLQKNKHPVHGKISKVIQVRPSPLLKGLPSTFKVTRYHSLQLFDLPSQLEVILLTEQGEIMGMTHQSLPILGVQYHPEAYLTEYGLELVENWIHFFVSKEGQPSVPKEKKGFN